MSNLLFISVAVNVIFMIFTFGGRADVLTPGALRAVQYPQAYPMAVANDALPTMFTGKSDKISDSRQTAWTRIAMELNGQTS
jgi:hypothetical protein